VQRRNAAHEAEYPLVPADVERAQDIGEPVRQPRQFGVGEVAPPAVLAEPAQCQPFTVTSGDVPVHGDVGDVDGTARQAVQLAAGGLPGKISTGAGVVLEVRGDVEPPGRFLDAFPGHRETSSAARRAQCAPLRAAGPATSAARVTICGQTSPLVLTWVKMAGGDLT